jgi:hypothetical protein
VAPFSAQKCSTKSLLSSKIMTQFSISFVVSINCSKESPRHNGTASSFNYKMMSSNSSMSASFFIIILWMIQHAYIIVIMMFMLQKRDGFWRIANCACKIPKHRPLSFCTVSCRSVKETIFSF